METLQENKLQAAKLAKQTNNRLIIAGPCSAETEAQMLQTAQELSAAGITHFRAGIWKPRTRPGSFEGIGSVGLQWLKTVQQEFGMKTSTEVANVKHVYECLKTGVDMLWIGARTTTNPFAIQEIAEALRGVDIPVMIKNPINSDVDLWIGAFERFQKVGIKQLIAIHRGFSVYNSKLYRNEPIWQIPIEFMRRNPEIPIICDPSHIAGNTHLIPKISQKALDLNYNGLIIETHCNPKEAWSDKAQQLTPAELANLLYNLVFRQPESSDSAFERELSSLRQKIDEADDDILEIMKQRMNIAQEIGKLKKDNQVTVLQNSRWEQLIQNRIVKGNSLGFSTDFINDLYRAIHRESISLQVNILNSK